MLKMEDESRRFLEKNLPEALETDSIGRALRLLYDLIDEKGFAPPHYDNYNDSAGKHSGCMMICI